MEKNLFVAEISKMKLDHCKQQNEMFFQTLHEAHQKKLAEKRQNLVKMASALSEMKADQEATDDTVVVGIQIPQDKSKDTQFAQSLMQWKKALSHRYKAVLFGVASRDDIHSVVARFCTGSKFECAEELWISSSESDLAYLARSFNAVVTQSEELADMFHTVNKELKICCSLSAFTPFAEQMSFSRISVAQLSTNSAKRLALSCFFTSTPQSMTKKTKNRSHHNRK